MTSRTKATLLGAVLGMTVLAAGALGAATLAGAQEGDEPEPVESYDDQEFGENDLEGAEWEAFDACLDEQLGDLYEDLDLLHDEKDETDEKDEVGEEVEKEEDAWIAAEEACADLLPEAVTAEFEAWRPFEECVDARLDGTEDRDDDENTDATEAAWEAAEEACVDLLPEDLRAELAAFDEFDACLAESGLLDLEEQLEEQLEGEVWIETAEGATAVRFGDVSGSVTISGTADDLVVTTTGGVTVLDTADLDAEWQRIDEAYETCEQVLSVD